MFSLFKRPPREKAYVEFGSDHHLCRVLRDADDRPYVLICSTAIRIDDPDEIKRRRVVWVTRRPEMGKSSSHD
jgi:hypothetical protein